MIRKPFRLSSRNQTTTSGVSTRIIDLSSHDTSKGPEEDGPEHTPTPESETMTPTPPAEEVNLVLPKEVIPEQPPIEEDNSVLTPPAQEIILATEHVEEDDTMSCMYPKY